MKKIILLALMSTIFTLAFGVNISSAATYNGPGLFTVEEEEISAVCVVDPYCNDQPNSQIAGPGGIKLWAHPYTYPATRYWGVQQACPAPTLAIVWVNAGPNGKLGWAYHNGCWYNNKVIWLNNYYVFGQNAPRIAGYGGNTAWCAVVTHELGHLVGNYWQYYPWDPWHNWGSKWSIMYPVLYTIPLQCKQTFG